MSILPIITGKVVKIVKVYAKNLERIRGRINAGVMRELALK